MFATQNHEPYIMFSLKNSILIILQVLGSGNARQFKSLWFVSCAVPVFLINISYAKNTNRNYRKQQ